MKTGWTSLGSAARCPQGRGGWSRGLISCFLHHARSGLRCSLRCCSLAPAGRRTRRRKGTATVVGQRQREESEQSRAKEGWHSPLLLLLLLLLSGYTYSDCRFKCLLITKLVPQPPRSRSLCIFISTSYGRFREREDVSYSSADAAAAVADRLSSPLRDTRQDDSFWHVLSLYSRCMRSRLAGHRHNRSHSSSLVRESDRLERTTCRLAGLVGAVWCEFRENYSVRNVTVSRKLSLTFCVQVYLEAVPRSHSSHGSRQSCRGIE